MLLLDLIEWGVHHPGELLFRSLILILLRNLIHIAKEEEIHWIRERVERLTGERYPGHTKRLWTRVVRNSRLFYLYLPKAIRRGKLRRITMNQINWITLVPALLGAAKLILQPFGIEISNEQINEIANGAAALATLIGVIMSHRKQGGGTTNGIITNQLESNK